LKFNFFFEELPVATFTDFRPSDAPERAAVDFDFGELVAVLQMFSNRSATDYSADAIRLSESQARWKVIRLKIRWALKGPCRFESGHRQKSFLGNVNRSAFARPRHDR
jgi:hypothetical protein